METEQTRQERFEAFQLAHEHAEDRDRKIAQAGRDVARPDRSPDVL